MLDFLFALAQFICVIGLLYGLVLTIVNWKYAGPMECRFDPAIGHDWCRDVPDERLELTIAPEPALTIMVHPIYRDPRPSEIEPLPVSDPAPQQARL